eukprot:11654557-Prorocentrum_lima.AAC.1
MSGAEILSPLQCGSASRPSIAGTMRLLQDRSQNRMDLPSHSLPVQEDEGLPRVKACPIF